MIDYVELIDDSELYGLITTMYSELSENMSVDDIPLLIEGVCQDEVESYHSLKRDHSELMENEQDMNDSVQFDDQVSSKTVDGKAKGKEIIDNHYMGSQVKRPFQNIIE